MTDEKDDTPLTEAEQAAAAAETDDRDAALRREKDRTKEAMLRRGRGPADRNQPASPGEPAAARSSWLRAEYVIVSFAALAMGIIASILLALSGGELAAGGRPILIPLAAEVVFLGVAILLIRALKRR